MIPVRPKYSFHPNPIHSCSSHPILRFINPKLCAVFITARGTRMETVSLHTSGGVPGVINE